MYKSNLIITHDAYCKLFLQRTHIYNLYLDNQLSNEIVVYLYVL